MTKYRQDPMTLVDRVRVLDARINNLERTPRFVSTSIDNGDMVVKANHAIITVKDTNGQPVLYIVTLNNQTAIWYAPPDTPNDFISYQWAFSNLGLDIDQQTYYQMAMVPSDASNFPIMGIALGETISSIEYINDDNTLSSYFQSRKLSLYGLDGNMRIAGRWQNRGQVSNRDGVHCGNATIAAGVSSSTYSYPATFASTMVPIVSLRETTGVVTWCITAQSNASFTVSWTGTLLKVLNWWCIRLP